MTEQGTDRHQADRIPPERPRESEAAIGIPSAAEDKKRRQREAQPERKREQRRKADLDRKRAQRAVVKAASNATLPAAPVMPAGL